MKDKYSGIQDLVLKNKDRTKVLREVMGEILGEKLGGDIKFQIKNTKESMNGVNIVYLKIIDKSSLRFLVIRNEENLRKLFFEKFGEELVIR